MHAPEPTGVPELSQRRRTECAPRGVRLLPAQLLLHAGQEIAERMLRHRDRGFDPTRCRALLAEILERHRVLLHFRDAHHPFAFLALVAQHQATTPRTSVSTNRPSLSSSARSARAARALLWVTTTMPISRSRASWANTSCSRSPFR